MSTVYVVSKYENWSFYWYKEYVKYCAVNGYMKNAVAKVRNRSFKDKGFEIFFVSNTEYKRMIFSKKEGVNTIYWDGDDIEKLFVEIEGAKIWLESD